MKTMLTFLLMAVSLASSALDDFSDGNFTANPTWTGSTADWQIVTSSDVAAGAANSNTLRLNGAAGGGTSYLSTQLEPIAEGTLWSFFVGRRGQPFTASNNITIWLWANEADLTSPTVDGYRIRIGDDVGGDEIVLQRVVDGVGTDILTGPALTNGLTDIGFVIRVDYEQTNGWYLYTSTLPTVSGTGTVASDWFAPANVYHGNVVDHTIPIFGLGGYVGFTATYSTSTAARTTQEFDNIQTAFTLPVTLRSFDALKEGEAVKLTWDVAEEVALQQYEVERSENGVHFTTIGNVSAEGKKKYSFTDKQPGSDTRFYRLKMVDIDGKSKLSHIVSVRSRSGMSMRAAPNPVRSVVHVQHPKATTNSRLQVFNTAGKLVIQQIVPENAVLTPLNLSSLPAGVYHLVFIGKDGKVSGTIVKD